MSQNTKDVNSTSGQDQQRNFQVSAGRDYPIIKINSYILGVSEISHMEISIQDFLPHISLEIKTSTNSLTGVNMPTRPTCAAYHIERCGRTVCKVYDYTLAVYYIHTRIKYAFTKHASFQVF